jgi:hypothetical protein
MNNNQLDVNLVIEELANQISALSLENAVLKSRIKTYEKAGEIATRIPSTPDE